MTQKRKISNKCSGSSKKLLQERGRGRNEWESIKHQKVLFIFH